MHVKYRKKKLNKTTTLHNDICIAIATFENPTFWPDIFLDYLNSFVVLFLCETHPLQIVSSVQANFKFLENVKTLQIQLFNQESQS